MADAPTGEFAQADALGSSVSFGVADGRLAGTADSGFSHAALLYRDDREYAERVAEFVLGGLAEGEPVLVAVPPDRARLLAGRLGKSWDAVHYTDMYLLGANPGRLIPHVNGFIAEHLGKRIRCVGEPAWPGRSAAELCEAIRHEALVNMAFAGQPVNAICPYDLTGLDRTVIGAAEHTHPTVISDGARRGGSASASLGQIPAEFDLALPPPLRGAIELRYQTDLAPVRELVASQAATAGLSPDRIADLVLAVSELAANTLRHAGGYGILHVWQLDTEVLCQVWDRGWIADPLAGRVRRPADGPGHGLWLVHQVCDLVELRSGPAGTQVRVHMRRTG